MNYTFCMLFKVVLCMSNCLIPFWKLKRNLLYKQKYITFKESEIPLVQMKKDAFHWVRSKNTLVKAERVTVSQGRKQKHSCYSGKGSIPLGKKYRCSCYSGK